MQVKAIKRGFCGVKVREPGEEFPFKGKLGSWMKAVNEEVLPVAAESIVSKEPVSEEKLDKPVQRQRKK